MTKICLPLVLILECKIIGKNYIKYRTKKNYKI